MSINHYYSNSNSNLPETHWWPSQYMMLQQSSSPPPPNPNIISSSSSSSSPTPTTTTTYWAANPQPLYHRNDNTLSFNLNNNDQDEELETEEEEDEDSEINNNFQINKEPLFEKPLTPSDVGKLNRLVIPKQYAEKYFPLKGVDSNEKGLLLSFEDEVSKSWRFRYSYWNSSQSYVLTKGWSRFVKEKRLEAGDVVLFFRHRLDAGRLFIGWMKRRSSVGEDGSVGGGGWNRVGHPPVAYPSHHQGSNFSLYKQPDNCLHAAGGSVVLQKQSSSSSRRRIGRGGVNGNLKKLRLFGVNLECLTTDEESEEPSTPEAGSFMSSQAQAQPHHSHPYHQFY